MRWIWIDRFIDFQSGKSARAIKNITLAEEYLHEHFPGYPVMPNSLIIEGIAQTGGLLVGEHNAFEEKVILAKIAKARFHRPARPGDTLTYSAEVQYINEDGASVTATSHVGKTIQAEVELLFAHLDESGGRTLFEPKNFVFTMRLLGVFDVGRDAQGRRLVEPPGLARFDARSEGGTVR